MLVLNIIGLVEIKTLICILFVLTLFFTLKKKGVNILLKIDREYSTNWSEECKYLLEHEIRYVFVKNIDGVTTWKYKKNEELFLTLAEFYANVYTR